MMVLLERVSETYNLRLTSSIAHDLLIRFTSSKMFLKEYDFLYDLYLK